MISGADLVAAEGAERMKVELAGLGLRPAPQLGDLYFLGDHTTFLGRTGVRIRGQVQSTRRSGRAWVVVATAFVYNPRINTILADAGWDNILPETVSDSLRGLDNRQLTLHDHREIATLKGARTSAITIRNILDNALPWWSGHFADATSTYRYLESDETFGVAKNALVGVALALQEGDSAKARQFVVRTFLDVPLGKTQKGYSTACKLVAGMGTQFSTRLPIPTWDEVVTRH